MRKKQRSELKAEERRGAFTVSCMLTDRYLKYRLIDPREGPNSVPVQIEVMTDRYGEKPDYKIATLDFWLEDLEVMVAQLRALASKKDS